MAVRENSKKKKVSTSSIRDCKYFLNYLAQRRIPLFLGNTSSADGYCAAINDALLRHLHSEETRGVFIKVMEQSCREELIDISNFEWLQNNDRACFYAWGYLRTASDQALGYAQPPAQSLITASGQLGYVQPASQTSTMYEQLSLANAPSSTKERFDTIVDFFDRWSEDISFKLQALWKIKFSWTHVYNGIQPFKWLNKKDEVQCEWVVEYISKVGGPFLLIQPINNVERYHGIIAGYDLWSAHPDTKKLFAAKIAKAWSQKKHRDSRVGKKPLNTYLKEETKLKLDELSQRNDKKIHEMLEKIICDEYDRSFN
ncbi:hypothetical protein [uncultured Amphritea sp.]|uniref:hypothetical protein n=1 Tax=uncultured Amphritea sp. TaxID=981605 RepID=UPI0025CDB682|nr:hypothetical protein [uncultured Amphritea sp.]